MNKFFLEEDMYFRKEGKKKKNTNIILSRA